MLTKESLVFLEDLKNNNNREWFHENKKRYDVFKKDYHHITQLFLDAMKPLDANLEFLEVKNCTFRINRDIRFSKDKSPYKTNLGIWMPAGPKGLNCAGYYVHIENENGFIAGGLHSPEPNDLKKIRKEIVFFYEDLDAIINQKDFKKEFNGFDITESNSLKTPPRGFDKEHPAINYLKLKSFTVSQNYDSTLVTQEDFVKNTAKKLIILKPLIEFLNRGLNTEE